jgi:hypothetical protein
MRFRAILAGAGLALLLLPTSDTQAQFTGGGGAVKTISAADCLVPTCTQITQQCVNTGTATLFVCNTSTSHYVAVATGGSPHAILSATHSDSTGAAVVRGDVIAGVGASPTWQRVAHSATTGGYTKWNGTDIVASTGAASGTGACGANTFASTINADAAPTCTQPAFSNLSGSATDAQIPDTITASNYTLLTAPQQKCVNIDPASATTDWLFWRPPTALTVTHVRCIVDAATSVVLTLRECDGDGGTCGATEAAITCATTTTSESGGVDDAAVAANVWMRVLRGTVTGTPAQAVLCMEYTIP